MHRPDRWIQVHVHCTARGIEWYRYKYNVHCTQYCKGGLNGMGTCTLYCKGGKFLRSQLWFYSFMYRCECEAGFRGVDCEVDIQVCNITSETGENRYIDGWIDSKGVILHQKQ